MIPVTLFSDTPHVLKIGASRSFLAIFLRPKTSVFGTEAYPLIFDAIPPKTSSQN